MNLLQYSIVDVPGYPFSVSVTKHLGKMDHQEYTTYVREGVISIHILAGKENIKNFKEYTIDDDFGFSYF